jgi:hypothetical protein
MTKKPAPNKPNSAPKKATGNGTLPATIINAAPATAAIVAAVRDAAAGIPKLAKDMERAKKGGAIPLARAFVALHRLKSRIDDELKPLDELFKRYKEVEVPQTFEAEGVTNVPLAEGFRVGLSSRLLASIPAEHRTQAYDWLRAHDLGDLISETVNAGTLSAAARALMEERNMELPPDLFTVAMVPNTSVTVTEKK